MQDVQDTVKVVWDFYKTNGRHDMPWRQPESNGSFNPYFILVSELMLQQTQVQRVIPKYHQFLARFPTVGDLAAASLAEVLSHWSGLGYNRRAKFLWQAAGIITERFNGLFPHEYADILTLPGVGPNTAAAIMTYAYDAPVTFLETNIRSVFIHHCFAASDVVTDAELKPIVDTALLVAIGDDVAGHSPRTWHWALMDYGTYVKQTFGNASARSKSYAKQSRFEGSRRQLRGQVLRILASGPLLQKQLMHIITDDRLESVLQDLQTEGLVTQKRDHFCLGTA